MNLWLALRRLPWYIAFCVILGPLILAPFTGFASLFWYPLYVVGPFQHDITGLVVWGVPIAIGTTIWFCRVFAGLFIAYWFRDHFTSD